MAGIHASITELIGNTPLVEFNRLEEKLGLKARIVGKLEYFNPAGSSKDRIALSMIEGAERDGSIGAGSTIVEFTSGNTGIGLAAVAAAKGYPIHIAVQPGTSEERVKLVEVYGATTFEPDFGGPDILSVLDSVDEYAAAIPHSWVPAQFNNENNRGAHYRTTGPEIWRDTEGKVDIFIAGVGTGGTVTGTGEYLKEQNPAVKIVAVQPHPDSISNPAEGVFVEEITGVHKFTDVDARLVPGNVHPDEYDEIAEVKFEEGLTLTQLLAREEGVLVGPSSGAALFEAVRQARKPENEGKLVVALLPDSGERYLSQDIFRRRPSQDNVAL